MPSKPQPHEHLIFAWNARDHSMWNLLAALLLMMIGSMASFFFIFRIVQPVVQRTPATPQHVISLDPNDPVALALIHRAGDRSFALLGDSEGTLPADAGLLPSFKPSFDGHRIQLRELDVVPARLPPRLLASMSDVLPPVPRRATEPAVVPPLATLRAVLSPELAKRAPADLDLGGIQLTQPTRAQFRVAIGSAGQVVTVLPLSATDDVDVMRQLHAAISNLRFEPSKSNRLDWGEITFRWEAAAP